MPHVLGMQEALKSFCRSQAAQDMRLFLCIEIGFAAHALELLLPPALFVLIGGVHEFRA